MNILHDPRLFNYVLMSLNIAGAIRFGIAGRWWDSGYWLSAFALTFCVTFRYQR
jgi:hypothetical protein